MRIPARDPEKPAPDERERREELQQAEETGAGDGDRGRAADLARRFDVQRETVEKMRADGKDWDEIETRLALVRELVQKDPRAHGNREETLLRIDRLRSEGKDWDEIVEESGIETGVITGKPGNAPAAGHRPRPGPVKGTLTEDRPAGSAGTRQSGGKGPQEGRPARARQGGRGRTGTSPAARSFPAKERPSGSRGKRGTAGRGPRGSAQVKSSRTSGGGRGKAKTAKGRSQAKRGRPQRGGRRL